MIKQELIQDSFWKNGLVKTYSDSNKYIVNKDGVKYEVAIDPKDFIEDRVYSETNEDIPAKEGISSAYNGEIQQ